MICNILIVPRFQRGSGFQVSTEHVASTPEGISELVTVTIQQPGGATYTLSGLIGAGIPLLVTLNNATFSPRVALEGTNLVYCSPSGTSVLGTVVGKIVLH